MTSDLFTESDSAVYSARILDEDNAADREVLAELRTDPRIEFVDRRDEQDRRGGATTRGGVRLSACSDRAPIAGYGWTGTGI
jgi:hypothetical protein